MPSWWMCATNCPACQLATTCCQACPTARNSMWPCLRQQLSPWRPNQQIASLRQAWNPAGDAPRQELIEHLSLPVLPAAQLDSCHWIWPWPRRLPCRRPTAHASVLAKEPLAPAWMCGMPMMEPSEPSPCAAGLPQKKTSIVGHSVRARASAAHRGRWGAVNLMPAMDIGRLDVP